MVVKIQPSTLFTEDHWKKGDNKLNKDILIKAATNGSPIWIKYKNSQGENSERFLINICLFYSQYFGKFLPRF